MEITKEMLNELHVPRYLARELLQKYIVYLKEPKPFTIQSHILTKEKGTLYPKSGSQHMDWRMKINGSLIGWSVVGGNINDPITPEKLIQNKGKGFRAEEKASQPIQWLNVAKKRQFIQTSGESPGIMEILTQGQWMNGASKVYFLEYFLKDPKYFKDWTRIVVRAIQVSGIDPRTKQPTKEKERLWRVMIPVEQMPYALSNRAISKGWKAPSNFVPFPENWCKKKFPKEYERWSQYMKGELSELSQIKFTLGLATWEGPVSKTHRRMPQFRWYLLLDDKSGKARTFLLDGYPIKDTVMAAYEQDRSDKKWMEYEGKIKAGTRFNPNKELSGEWSIIDKGNTEYEEREEDGISYIHLKLKGGKLKGKWDIIQEEKGTNVYTFQKDNLAAKELSNATFILDSHEFPENSNKIHYDFRWINQDTGKGEEFNLADNPISSKVEEPIKAVRKECHDVEWFEPKKDKRMKAHGVWTKVNTIDYGKVEVLEDNPEFISFDIKGNKLNGYFTTKKLDGTWEFMKSRVPTSLMLSDLAAKFYELEQGNPSTGNPFNPLIVEQKHGWNYFIIHIYDLRKFTKVESSDKVSKYLDISIPDGTTIGVGLYPVPGKLSNARIAYVKFDTSKWNEVKAEQWISSNKLVTWNHIQIRE